MIQNALTTAIHKAQSQNKVSKKKSADALANLVITCINGLRVAEKWGAKDKIYKDVSQTVISLF
jgi:hypothetical protein